ncbi:RNA polymerase sigma factor SigJ [Kutzneria albida]|uniref:RNA polymerase sigma factor SigJ n=1 Tax=Kutzneria albida DSM 43870 TaxID=1449976 RepID=W5WA64_9PSEU|nr:RNA polymerase sigma factor SigJ [Kutzneria albida]AHH95099.1 RNA polymerase sigma factor SigJ [Kutzneria albida DSM 43870]
MSLAEEELAQRFTEHRAHLVGVAYRLTGRLGEAEDAVQEAWLRLAGRAESERAAILDLRAWLTTVVGRICLDQLRSARARRERYVGPWLPEPLVTPIEGGDPLDVIVREDGVRMAAMVVLHELTPEQRVAFVLHDAFGVPFPEIAATLGCSPAAARQHASRARKAVGDADAPSRVDLAEQQAVLEQFMLALAAGDTEAVLRVLHPDVVVVGDGGGLARTARRVVSGAEKVARFALGLLSSYGAEALSAYRVVLVNGDLGMLTAGVDARRRLDRRVSCFALREGKIVGIYDVANPDKLSRVPF